MDTLGNGYRNSFFLTVGGKNQLGFTQGKATQGNHIAVVCTYGNFGRIGSLDHRFMISIGSSRYYTRCQQYGTTHRHGDGIFVDGNLVDRITGLEVFHPEGGNEYRIGGYAVNLGIALFHTGTHRKHGIETFVFHIFVGLAGNHNRATRGDFPTVGIVGILDVFLQTRLHVHGDANRVGRIYIHLLFVGVGKIHRQDFLTGTSLQIGHIGIGFAVECSEYLRSYRNCTRARLRRRGIAKRDGYFSFTRLTRRNEVNRYNTFLVIDGSHRVIGRNTLECNLGLIIIQQCLGRNGKHNRVVQHVVTLFRGHLGHSAVIGDTSHPFGQVAQNGNRGKGIFAIFQRSFQSRLLVLTAINGYNSAIAQQLGYSLVGKRPSDGRIDDFSAHIGNLGRNLHRIAYPQRDVRGVEGDIHLGRTIERGLLFTGRENGNAKEESQK